MRLQTGTADRWLTRIQVDAWSYQLPLPGQTKCFAPRILTVLKFHLNSIKSGPSNIKHTVDILVRPVSKHQSLSPTHSTFLVVGIIWSARIASIGRPKIGK